MGECQVGRATADQFTERRNGEHHSVPFFWSIFSIAVVDVPVSAAIFLRSWGNINWAGEMGQESRSSQKSCKHRSMALGRTSVIFLSFSNIFLSRIFFLPIVMINASSGAGDGKRNRVQQTMQRAVADKDAA